MPTPTNSLAKARLTGAAAKDPQRYRDRSEPRTSGQPVGKPPAHLNATCKAVWRDLSASLGWLVKEDRAALELASVALGQVRDFVKQGEPVPASLLAASNSAIGKLGATPTDRQKVTMQPDDDDIDDPWRAFEVKGSA